MKIEIGRMPKDEQLPLLLCGLFEQRGYRRYRMSNFEAYDLYRENKNFLQSEGIITFTDATGRLMALKPDVTMSIVKQTKPDVAEQKLYYIEHVFRMAPQGGQYQEISQMGLEYIGGLGGYAEAEAVELALKSLADIGAQSVLNVGHMGFVTGLLDALGVQPAARAAALAALRDKNMHTLHDITGESRLSKEQTAHLFELASLAGPFGNMLHAADDMLAELKKAAAFPETADESKTAVSRTMDGIRVMAAALEELWDLYDALHALGALGSLRLDLSTLGDIDYYNGIVFKGYVKDVPRAVLSGGRYDHLMRRFGKPQAAVGFALYLSELNRLFQESRAYDVDTLLLYEAQHTPAQVAAAVRTLSLQGSVFAALAPPEGLRARRTVHLRGTAFLPGQPAENLQEAVQETAADRTQETVENPAQKPAHKTGGDGTC